MIVPIKWKPELWKKIKIDPALGSPCEVPPKKSFFDPQDPSETYEVRGILPRVDQNNFEGKD